MRLYRYVCFFFISILLCSSAWAVKIDFSPTKKGDKETQRTPRKSAKTLKAQKKQHDLNAKKAAPPPEPTPIEGINNAEGIPSQPTAPQKIAVLKGTPSQSGPTAIKETPPVTAHPTADKNPSAVVPQSSTASKSTDSTKTAAPSSTPDKADLSKALVNGAMGNANNTAPTYEIAINTQNFNLDGCIQLKFTMSPDAQISAFFLEDSFLFLTTDTCKFAIPQDLPPYIQRMENMSVQGGSALRLYLKKNIVPYISHKDRTWTIELGEKRQDIPEDLIVQYAPAPQSLNILKLTGAGLGRIMGFQDQFGQLVIAITHPELAVRQRDYNREFDIIPTVRGLVLLPHQNDFRIDAVGAGEFLIRSLHTHALSTVDDRTMMRSLGKPPGLINIMKWDVGPELVTDLMIVLKQKIYQGSPSLRKRAYIDLAEFYMANGFYPEMLGIIDTVQSIFPEERHNDALNILYDLGDVLAHNYKDFDYIKSGDTLSYESESDIIRGIDLVKHGKYLEGANALSQSLKVIQNLPQMVRNHIALYGFEASVMQKMGGLVFYNFINPDLLADSQRDYFRFLEALQLKHKGDLRSALVAFKKLYSSENPKVQVLAQLESIDLKKEPASRLIPFLEDLRFQWRGDSVEYRLLTKLFELYTQEKKPWQALGLLYTMNDFFPQYGTTEDRMVQGQNLFYKTFKDGGLQPLRQLAFYNEFQKFIPPDDRYIEVHQMLFETLFRMDLIDQAHQAITNVMRDLPQMMAKHKINPVSGTQFFHDCALRLANFHLQEEKPDRALRILDNLTVAQMKPGDQEKMTLLKARAYFEMDHLDQSTQLLTSLNNLPAKQLLSTILMKQQKWDEAKQVLEPLLKETPPPDVIINMAIVYQGLQDMKGLKTLRDVYAGRIKDPKKKEALLLLTSASEAPRDLSHGEIKKEIQNAEQLQKLAKEVR